MPPGARNEKFCQDIWKESEIFVDLDDSEKLPLIVTEKAKESSGKTIEEKETLTSAENDIKDEPVMVVTNKNDEQTEEENSNEENEGIEEKVAKKSAEKGDENILRFRKINDRNDFLNMNGKNDHNEAKDRS